MNLNEKKAKKLLKKNLYLDSIITYAKSFLDACPQNAVLYTWEEIDTYPLYYLQATKGYRADVIIINPSLLSFSKYIKLVYNGPYKSKPLETSIPERVFDEITHIYNRTNESSDSTSLSAKEFFNILAGNEIYKNLKPFDQHLFLNYNKLTLKIKDSLGKEKIIEFSLPRLYFFGLISQIDILYTHKNNRPILISKHLPEDRLKRFSNLKSLGNVYLVGG